MNSPDFAASFERSPTTMAPAYFADISVSQAVEHTYTKRYPELWKAIRLLEVIYGTDRAMFYRIVDLTLGYLEATDTGKFKRWDQITCIRWNASTLSHERLPQEFVTIVMECQADILSSCWRDSEIWIRVFSKTTNLQTFIEALSDKPRSMDSSVFRDSIVPKIVTIIENQNHWANNIIQSKIGSTIFFGPEIARQLLQQVRTRLMKRPDIEVIYSDTYKKTRAVMNITGDIPTAKDTRELFQTVHIDIPLLETGIIELVNLELNLIVKNYSEIYRVLSTQKTKKGQLDKIGRLKDPNYECLLSGYAYIATIFFQTVPTDMKKIPSHKKGDISRLNQLFQKELGISRKAVEMVFKLQTSVVPAQG